MERLKYFVSTNSTVVLHNSLSTHFNSTNRLITFHVFLHSHFVYYYVYKFFFSCVSHVYDLYDFGVQNCQYAPIHCPHKQMGCPFKGPKVELPSHLKICPYDLLKDYITRTEQQIIALKQQLEVFLSFIVLCLFFPSLRTRTRTQTQTQKRTWYDIMFFSLSLSFLSFLVLGTSKRTFSNKEYVEDGSTFYYYITIIIIILLIYIFFFVNWLYLNDFTLLCLIARDN